MSRIFILIYVGILAISQCTLAWHDNDWNSNDEFDIFVRERFDDNVNPWSISGSSEEWRPQRPLPPPRPLQPFPFPQVPQNRPFPQIPQNRPFPVPQNRPLPLIPQNRPLPVLPNRPLPVPQTRLTTTTLIPRTNPGSSTAIANPSTATSATTTTPLSTSTLVTTTPVRPTTQLVQRDESSNGTTFQSTPTTTSSASRSTSIASSTSSNSTISFISRDEVLSPTTTHIALNELSAESNESSEDPGTTEHSMTLPISSARPLASSAVPLLLFLDPGQDQNDSPDLPDPINHANTTQNSASTADNSAHDPEPSTTTGSKSGNRPDVWTMKEWILIPVNVFVAWIRGENSEDETTLSENDAKFFPF